MQSKLDSVKFSIALKEKRGKTNLRDAAKEIGDISAATLSRVEQGNLPDVLTFIKICNWLQVSVDSFVLNETKNESITYSEKDNIVYQLRSSKTLNPDTVNAIVTMVNLAYDKL